jgi:hypothetical protein
MKTKTSSKKISKLSKFAGLVLVTFVAIGLVAPQQAEAVKMVTVDMHGNARVTPPEPGGNVGHMMTLSNANLPDGPPLVFPSILQYLSPPSRSPGPASETIRCFKGGRLWAFGPLDPPRKGGAYILV